ncbi:MAG: LysR family transcriptional regulator [Variovorax sp.]|nr:LysR family transcriptional regulator [Variovorax sp.]
MPLAIRDVEYFLAVAEVGQLAQAASNLGLTPAALSKSIRRLEDELGLRTFERSGQGMQLTAFGTAFVERARRICVEHDEALRHASDVRTGRAGLLRIGASIAMLETFVAPALAKLQPKRPAMRAQVIVAASDVMLERLRNGHVDMAVVPTYDKVPPDLKQLLVGSDSLVPVVREGHPLLNMQRLRLTDLSSYSWILPSAFSAARTRLDELFASVCLKAPQVSIEVDVSSAWTLSIVRATDLISFAPSSLMDTPVTHHIVAVPLPQLVLLRAVSLFFRPEAYWSPLMDEFAGALRAAGQDMNKS